MANGILIGESVRVGASLEGVTLAVDKVYRLAVGDETSGQPRIWTFIEFEIPDGGVHKLATALTNALDPASGWYCDFRSAEDTFVVFAGRMFRYRRGDQTGRSEAENYARSIGVPEAQLDWPE
jgi:hypothetical protein